MIAVSAVSVSAQADSSKFWADFKEALVEKDTVKTISFSEFPFYTYDEVHDFAETLNQETFKRKILPYIFSGDFLKYYYHAVRIRKVSTEFSDETLKKINAADKSKLYVHNFDFGSFVFQEINGKFKFIAVVWVPVNPNE